MAGFSGLDVVFFIEVRYNDRISQHNRLIKSSSLRLIEYFSPLMSYWSNEHRPLLALDIKLFTFTLVDWLKMEKAVMKTQTSVFDYIYIFFFMEPCFVDPPVGEVVLFSAKASWERRKKSKTKNNRSVKLFAVAGNRTEPAILDRSSPLSSPSSPRFHRATS